MSNNLYLVVSDWITELGGHAGEGRVADLVIARNPSQARYLAWRPVGSPHRYSWGSDLRDMPRFQVRLKRKGIDREPGIVSNDPEYAHVDELWDLGEDREVA